MKNVRWMIGTLLGLVLVSQTLAQTAPNYWSEIKAFRKEDSLSAPPANPILFVGSSSFTKWKDVRDYFPGYPIINRGFGGSTLVDVIRYAYDIILPYHPKQVVIYCGENDMAYIDTLSPNEVINRFKTLYGMIRQNLPRTVISYVSIKPSPAREKFQEKAKIANAGIRAFLKGEKFANFIDIYPAMLDANGKMRPEIYEDDRLHMKAEGYVIWKGIIGPFLIR